MTTFGLILITAAKFIAGMAIGVIIQAIIDERHRRRSRAHLRELIERHADRDEAQIICDLLDRCARK